MSKTQQQPPASDNPVATPPASPGASVSPLASAPMKRSGRYVNPRLDIQLPHSHAQALRDLFDGLYESRAKLRNGKDVERPQQAVLWILENLPGYEVPKSEVRKEVAGAA